VYGHKAGMALTYDVIKPAKPNGAAVLFMVSGGWVSGWADPAPLLAAAMAGKDRNAFGMLLDRGFTLILVRHGSSPYFKVPDAVSDVRRAVRHVRLTAANHGIDPQRIGVFGGSAGGHLSLMLGTTSDNGNPAAADPVEKTANRVAAVVAYYPPTDLTGYIGDKRFPATHFPADQCDAVSPLKHVTPDDAPSLLVHGGKDTLVTPSHSENILAAFKKEGVPAELIAFPEAGHSFTGEDEKTASTALVAWFEKHLTRTPAPPAAGAAAPVGTWEAQATLPDGGSRPSTLTIRQENGQLTAVAKNEQGERKIDRVKWEKDRLLLEIDMERDDRKGSIRVSASKNPDGKLTGTWDALDDAGNTLVSGAWEAAPKAAAP
jgi:acetyl esterase/lipase